MGALVFAAPASAQPDGSTPPEAVESYRQAREHYAAGEYREAAADLEHALTIDPDSPTLVYNLARVYELLGELDRSVELYERYQVLLPAQQAQEQERAEATLRRLRGAQSSDAAEPAPAPREVEPLRQLPGIVLVRENGVADEAFWITLIGGAVSLALGATFGGLALVSQQSGEAFVLRSGGQPSERDDLFRTAGTLGIATDVTLGLGGVAIVAAGLLYFFREHTVERAPIGAGDTEVAVGFDGQTASVLVWGAM